MYILDTNVISELRKVQNGKGDKNVAAWAVSLPASLLFLSVITVLELEFGTLRLERHDPVQGNILREWLERLVLPTFQSRTLPIDTKVALRCAVLHVPNRRPDRDAFIGATALVHGMTVVTRNIVDFAPMGVPVINPWEPQ